MFASELSFRSAQFAQAPLRLGKHVLHIDASHGPSSVVAHGAQAFVTELSRTVPEVQYQHLRLWDDAVRSRMEYSLEHVQAKMSMLAGGGSTEEVKRFADIEELAVQVATARALIVSAPIWNYGAPWVLKQYIDCVLHPGLTFRETTSGAEGVLGQGRALVLISSAGGAATTDHMTPWMVDVAAMMGFSVPTVVSVTRSSQRPRVEVVDNITRDATAAARHVGFSLFSLLERENGPPDAEAVKFNQFAAKAAEWTADAFLDWLKGEGGLTLDGLESIEAVKIDGRMWLGSSGDDWRSDELGLEESDVQRLQELRIRHLGTEDVVQVDEEN
uniref:Flavodoxin-like fold domain-containing protein n=1 Tax=Noctiluca scintillans TaxID=2966 RepID=A0A7S1FAD9_NOCSC|mmetsp:Transcript_47824/g.126587  ORF Transcript_47824/g.126587 Transcript_47824/m.126587 type:complete len:330 (+) Transcript_47824:20-1009(+)